MKNTAQAQVETYSHSHNTTHLNEHTIGFSLKLISLDFSNTLNYFLVKYLWSETSQWVSKHRPGLLHIQYSCLTPNVSACIWLALPGGCEAMIYILQGRGVFLQHQILTHVPANCGQIWLEGLVGRVGRHSCWFLSTESWEGQSWPSWPVMTLCCDNILLTVWACQGCQSDWH